MLEQQEKQFTKEQAGLDEKQLFQKNINDFIEVIPEKGPLNDKSEMREMTTRAITFGQLYNQLSAISEGAQNLNREQISKIMKRVETLKKEAHFWTGKTDTGRDFAEEIKEMAQLIWRK